MLFQKLLVSRTNPTFLWLHPRISATPAQHSPAPHVGRMGYGGGHVSFPAERHHGGHQGVRTEHLFWRAADRFRGLAVSGVRGALTSRAIAYRTSGKLCQVSKGIRQWPINLCTLAMMKHKITPSVIKISCWNIWTLNLMNQPIKIHKSPQSCLANE